MTSKESIESVISHQVEAGQLAGAATLAWRDGRLVHTGCVGRRDLTTGLPVERDTIFRIASMTKPVTTVAALMLLDEGRFELDEPIAVCAPEFARMRVLRGPEGPFDRTDEARPITFRDLLTYRSGLYLAFARTLMGDPPNGVTLLPPGTLAMMTSNQLTPDQRATARLLGRPIFAAGHGYGMGVAVVMEPAQADSLRCRGGAGAIGWPGAYGRLVAGRSE